MLYGSKRKLAKRWLSAVDANPCEMLFHIPSAVKDYINASYDQGASVRCMYHLHQLTRKLVQHPWFDKVIGYLAIANPLALLPQLCLLIEADNTDAISVPTWLIFLMLQMSTALFSIKHRNFGLFLVQFDSMVIT